MKVTVTLIVLLSLFNCCDAFGSLTSCSNCLVEHPQEQICAAQYAFVGTVMNAEDLTQWLRYWVQITDDTQVFKGLSLVGVGTDHVNVDTPYRANLCGRTNLETSKAYLFTGSFYEGRFVITLCDWVEDWKDVSPKQKDYLLSKEYLNHCNLCEVVGVKIHLTANQNDKDDQPKYPGQISGLWTPYGCYYNPIASIVFRSDDCETVYSYCRPAEDGAARCDWKLTQDYEKCFLDREGTWQRKNAPRPAAALTKPMTVKDCRQLESRKMKKKCLWRVKQYIKEQKEMMAPKEMFKEMIDLRDLWLDDELIDEEE